MAALGSSISSGVVTGVTSLPIHGADFEVIRVAFGCAGSVSYPCINIVSPTVHNGHASARPVERLTRNWPSVKDIAMNVPQNSQARSICTCNACVGEAVPNAGATIVTV